MPGEEGLKRAAQLFKVLGNPSRLRLVVSLIHEPRSVGELATEIGLSQPLVSQHLRTLRDADVVSATRHGNSVIYSLADHHITHVLEDALVHADEDSENRSAENAPKPRTEGRRPG